MPANAKIKAVLFLFALIALAMLAIPFFLIPPGGLIVRLADEVFNADLADKKAHLKIISSEQEMTASIQRDAEGYGAAFSRIESGQVEIRVKGYKPHTASVDIPPMESAMTGVSLIPTFGRVKVFALNAKNKKRLSNFMASAPSANRSASGGSQGAILSELEPEADEVENWKEIDEFRVVKNSSLSLQRVP